MKAFYEEPLFFERNRVYRVYKGGKLFADFFGDEPEDGNYPEEWVVSTVHALNDGSTDEYEGISKIKGTDLYLSDAVNQYKKELLGDREDIGVLTKILDSAIRLPIQAHPDKEFSKKYFNSNYGKEESWIVLATRPNAKMYYGFKKGTTLEDFEKAIEESETGSNAMEELMNTLDIKVGDVIYLPAKFCHAIGAGCMVLEVQEPTDFTVQPERYCGDHRLTDHEMYLGLDKKVALQCFDMDKTYPVPLKPKILEKKEGLLYEALIDSSVTPTFSVNMATISGGEFSLAKGCAIYVVLEGSGEIIGEEYKKEIKKGDYFFMPAFIKNKFKVTGDIKIAECFA